jgi:hypothetical protein
MPGPDVIGPTEGAAILGGVSLRRFWALAGADDFPPYTQLANGRVWDRAAVKAWALDREIRLGRRTGKAAHGLILSAWRATLDEHATARSAAVSVDTVRRVLRRVGAV